jgi:hypothetical protein
MELHEMSLKQLAETSAQLTREKDQYMHEYAQKQHRIHAMLHEKQQEEKRKRDMNPEYKAKEQTIG